MHPTRRARRKVPSRKEPVPVTEAPTVDLDARTGATEQLDPRLPHERDESASGKPAHPRGIEKQAHDDLASGQVDTDLRNSTEEIIAKKSHRGLRHKP